VSPELDRIVLKALARDVSQRYQTSADLFADLKAVLEGYRFDVRELRDFMRKEFRREYTKEHEDTGAAMTSLPLAERLPAFDEAPPAVTAVTKAPAKPRVEEPRPPSNAPMPSPTPEEVAAANSDKPGFFSRMFKKRR
jgi:hypothetical protein